MAAGLELSALKKRAISTWPVALPRWAKSSSPSAGEEAGDLGEFPLIDELVIAVAQIADGFPIAQVLQASAGQLTVVPEPYREPGEWRG